MLRGTVIALVHTLASLCCGEMPTYRFDVRDDRTIRDPHGLDLADDDAARRHGQLLAQNLGPMVGGHINLFVDVVDEDGNVVATYEVR